MVIDTNTWVGHWPFHPFDLSTPGELADRLASEGIDRAWVAPAEAVLFPDPQIGNERWLPLVAEHERLVPVAVIDPTYGNWRPSLERCVDEWRARVVKLVPTYRCFELDDPRVDELIAAADEMGLVVSVQIRLEDERRHHPLMKVPPPDKEALLALSRRHPDTLLHLACAYVPELTQLAKAENFMFEISSLERLDTLSGLLEVVPPERLCFGSHTPFYYTRAARLKLETASVPQEVVETICNAPEPWR